MTKTIEKIKSSPGLKRFVLKLISPSRNPRPRLWVRWFVNPFVHKKGKGAVIRRRRSRIDVFPWHRFDVGPYALIEDFTTINNGAGDVEIGAGARIGIGSVVIGPVSIGEKAGLGQHVFISGFNHGYSDGTRDSDQQELVRKEVVIGRESHIGSKFGSSGRSAYRRTGTSRGRKCRDKRHTFVQRSCRQPGPRDKKIRP